jgi:hypothetical protein
MLYVLIEAKINFRLIQTEIHLRRIFSIETLNNVEFLNG